MEFHPRKSVVMNPLIASESEAVQEGDKHHPDCFVACARRNEDGPSLLSSGLSSHAQVTLEHDGIGPHLGAGRVMYDRTALQYHDAVGKP
jgi:hypothetical protein